MFEDLGRIADILDKVLVEMEKSNKLMEKLTDQLKILTLPPNMKAYKINDYNGDAIGV